MTPTRYQTKNTLPTYRWTVKNQSEYNTAHKQYLPKADLTKWNPTAKKKNQISTKSPIDHIANDCVCSALYLKSHIPYSDLRIHTIEEAAEISYKLFYARLANRCNPPIFALNSESISGNPSGRFKSNFNRDLKLPKSSLVSVAAG